MPRQSRIDFPGVENLELCRKALHHIAYYTDQRDFLDRLSKALTSSQTPCYAYALMSNHFHLLLQTGPTPIS